ncbi:MAG: hypothetical protein AW10_02127 [Candidatus Accumulibacter appositus]|uniref:DUF934 domain-containing protein n=1 Tax=Candidatus Accumulibacter appositus TaxID=1454003 RepID=A0A011PSN1_9PROT|nr:DUF934 domain-containing protein [Accumulibacter sp.]EXI79982.1 MAG: hypothetical protein AW10_02127 [Candidatus Accumulibacter appositus]HRF04094.1 DUF934 domain-containing protein [Accumulibacter sp.]
MPRIIKHMQVIEDHWQMLTLAEGETPEAVALPAEPTLLPLAVWLLRRDEIVAAGLELGVWLDAGEGPEALADDLERLPVIGVNFPKFTDGRSYSSARLLRERYAYHGEIRALGDVQQDQLFYMRRCGIDAYAVRADKDIDKALAGLAVFSETYQAAVDQPQPLFRRRAAHRQEAA